MAAKKLKLLLHRDIGSVQEVPSWWSDRHNPVYAYRLDYFKEHDKYDVVDNFEFTEKLTFVRFYQGNSSFGGIFKREHSNNEVYVWASNMTEFVQNMVLGTIEGTFTFAKHGQSLAIVRVNNNGKSLF